MKRIQIQPVDQSLGEAPNEMVWAAMGASDGARIQAARLAFRSVMEKNLPCGPAGIFREGSAIDPWVANGWLGQG